MLEIKVENGNVDIKAHGSSVQIATELGAAVKGLYKNCLTKGEKSAKFFKYLVQRGFSDDSPVWTGEGIQDFVGVCVDMGQK